MEDPSSIPSGENVRSWFEEAAEREYRGLAKARLREEARIVPLSEQALASTAQDALESLVSVEADERREELLKAIRDAIKSLPDLHRKIIERSYFHGQTMAEIAVGLGKPEAAVRQMRFRAVRSLQRALRENLAGGESSRRTRGSQQ